MKFGKKNWAKSKSKAKAKARVDKLEDELNERMKADPDCPDCGGSGIVPVGCFSSKRCRCVLGPREQP